MILDLITSDIIFWFYWIGLSILLALAGQYRTIGSWGAFLLSIIFSPIAGAIGVSLSQRVSQEVKTEKENGTE